MFLRSLAVSVLFVSVMLGAMLWQVPAASAQTEFVDVPAVAFVLGGNSSYSATFGVVEGDGGEILRAAVRLRHGYRLCQVKFWAHDFDAGDVTVRLMRKAAAPDPASSFGSAPEAIVTVTSSGSSNTLRAFATSVDLLISVSYLYWVELEFPAGPIQVSGIRIRTAATAC